MKCPTGVAWSYRHSLSHTPPTTHSSPPVLIENELKAALPSVASCMVVGDKRKFLTVLLTLHADEEGRLTGRYMCVYVDNGEERRACWVLLC